MDSEQYAWREILARVFDGFNAERDVSPTWLTNPQTGRLLKLNYLFPEIRLGIRLEGLRGREPRVGPDEVERHRQAEREAERERLCEAQGVRLVHFDVHAEPQEIFDAMQSALSWAIRQAAKAAGSPEDKLHLVEQLHHARARLDEIRPRLRGPRDLQTWADLWVDRAYQEARTAPRPAHRGPVPRYVLNMHVRHTDFGTGRITALTDEDGDEIVTVRFESGDERQFLAQLVTDKLRPC